MKSKGKEPEWTLDVTDPMQTYVRWEYADETQTFHWWWYFIPIGWMSQESCRKAGGYGNIGKYATRDVIVTLRSNNLNLYENKPKYGQRDDVIV